MDRIAVRMLGSGEVRWLYAIDAESLIEAGAAEPFLGEPGTVPAPKPPRKARRKRASSETGASEAQTDPRD